MLNVEWPSIALVNVPTHLETYSNDVEIKAKFTTNLCSQMVVSPMEKNVGNKERSNDISAGSRVPHRLPFKTYLELIRCPPQMNTRGYLNTQGYDCQVRSNGRALLSIFPFAIKLKIRLNFLYSSHLILQFSGSYKPCRLKSVVFQTNPKFIQP